MSTIWRKEHLPWKFALSYHEQRIVDDQNIIGKMHVTQSIFLLPRCDSNCHIVLNIMKLLKETNFEAIDFNMYVMQLIGMKNS